MHDDPWWDTHYPPSGWGCSCGVRPLSRREMERHQLARGKAAKVDVAPPDDARVVTDPLTGDVRQVPAGISDGWDHQPGDGWERGLVPPHAAALDPLPAIAEPIGVPVGRPGQDAGAAVDAFLEAFGAQRGPGGARLWRDAAGQAVTISEELFQDPQGRSKISRRGVDRAMHLPRLAEAMRDPDEIWVDWTTDPATSKPRLARRYLRYDPAGGGFVTFSYAPGFGWSGTTAFPPKAGKSATAQDGYLTQYRTGSLLYRRPGSG